MNLQCNNTFLSIYYPSPAFDFVAKLAVHIEARGQTPIEFVQAGLDSNDLEQFEKSHFKKSLATLGVRREALAVQHLAHDVVL